MENDNKVAELPIAIASHTHCIPPLRNVSPTKTMESKKEQRLITEAQLTQGQKCVNKPGTKENSTLFVVFQ